MSSPSRITRRGLLRGAGTGALVVAAGGVAARGNASASGQPRLRVLNEVEEKELNAWCEVLVPGAGAVALPGSVERGVARFVDHQLAAPPVDVLLTIRSDSDVQPPYADFYRSGVAALTALSVARGGARFSSLDGGGQVALVKEFTGLTTPRSWKGPPSALWYFLTRADAVDIVFGTPQGFADLGFPYLAHMAPPPTMWVTAREHL